MNSKLSLFSQPNNILELCFQHLKYKDLIHVKSTCRKFHDLIQSSPQTRKYNQVEFHDIINGIWQIERFIKIQNQYSGISTVSLRLASKIGYKKELSRLLSTILSTLYETKNTTSLIHNFHLHLDHYNIVSLKQVLFKLPFFSELKNFSITLNKYYHAYNPCIHLEKILVDAPHLETFSLSSSAFSCLTSNTPLLVTSLQELGKYKTTLLECHLENIKLTNAPEILFLTSLIHLKKLTLKKISFSLSNDTTPFYFLQNLPKVDERGTFYSDYFFVECFGKLQELRELELEGKMTWILFLFYWGNKDPYSYLSHLEKLVIENPIDAVIMGFPTLLKHPNFRNLYYLELIHFNTRDYHNLFQFDFLLSLPKLSKLIIEGGYFKDLVLPVLENLKELKIRIECRNYDEKIFPFPLSSKFKSLTRLSLLNFSLSNSDSYFLKQIPNLEKLTLF